jgi:hypothetical protein
MGRMLILLALAVGCSKPPPAPAQITQAQPSARAFVDQLLGALERSDLPEWKQLLSSRMRATLATDDLAQTQLDSWRRDVLPLAPVLRSSDVALADHVLTYSGGIALAQVAIEGGRLKLDEN